MKLYTKLYTMRTADPKLEGNTYQKIEAFVLPNGLKAFYDHVPDTPLVSIQVWVNTGSADEPPRSAGIAHLIEHMFFKGAANKKISVIAKEIEALGGYINAFTSFEETVFYVTIKSDYFDRALDVLAQTIRNPSFDEGELKMEREVVLDEIKRGKDDTYQTLFLALYDLAYQGHPYGRPIIGSEDTVRSLTRESILAHYKRWYAPANITIVIAGDVPRQQVERGVHAAFGGMRSNGAVRHLRPGQPEQRRQRSIVRGLDVKDTYYAMGFLTPPATDDSSFALEVLAYILGGNDTSRLPRIVKMEKRLVDSIIVSHSANRYTGFFSVSGTTTPDKLKGATGNIMDTIADTAVRLPTHEEVERAKQVLKSTFIYDLETVKQRGMKIGEAVVEMGGLGYIMNYTKKIDGVGLEEIRSAIEKYLRPDRLNVVGILPKKGASAGRGSVSRGRPAGSAMGYTLKRVGSVLVATFENGLRVILKEKHTIPIVALSALFFGDSAGEPRDRIGLINIMAMLLKKGTRYRKEADIERESDTISGLFSYIRTKQSFGMTGEFLNRYADDGLNLFADMLLNPAFESEEIARAKRDVLTDIKADRDNIGLQARNAFLRLLYGRSPLSLSEKGDEGTVRRIDRQDIVHTYDELVCGRNGVVSVVGAMDGTELVKKIARHLAAIRTGRSHVPAQHSVPPAVRREKTERYRMEKNQAHIITGTLTMPVNHRDRFAIMLLDQILGGQSGRLFVELRDKRGICYAVQTIGEAKLNNKGWFGVYTATSPEKVEVSLGVIRSELGRLYRDGVNDIELGNSKRYLLSDYDSRKQMALSVAGMLAFNELFERSADYYTRLPGLIQRVTRSEMNDVIRRYFSPDRFSTLVLMPG